MLRWFIPLQLRWVRQRVEEAAKKMSPRRATCEVRLGVAAAYLTAMWKRVWQRRTRWWKVTIGPRYKRTAPWKPTV
jgi:hypothetical protein